MIAFLSAAILSLAPGYVSDQPTFDQRLELLAERIEQERVNNHIPGLALVVVKDDEVVMMRGFGLADVDAGRAVDAQTLFAIGSTTKAFTSTAIGMLQDDGKLDFDDPVTSFLPYFELQVDKRMRDRKESVTLRDLMCHRTGFTRMSNLWVSGAVSRKRILEAATNAEPLERFRQKFQYNNVMFLAAGMAGGAAAESSWEEVVQGRILDPLGMQATTLTTAAAKENEHLALGYEWNLDTLQYKRKSMLELGGIGPAGSINSNATDMAQWLRLQLGAGEVDGKRLISAAALAETYHENISMGGGVGYGMGWMLREGRHGAVVEHGGNIDGFAAEVAMIPSEKIGFVLLTNVTMTPLQQTSITTVFDTLLGEIIEPRADLGDYVGHYTANFGPFENADFEVSVVNGGIAVNVPGQTNYELLSPDDEGKWYFKLTDTIAVGFVRDDVGAVTDMLMYQNGLAFDIPREGITRPIEIELTQLEPFLGTYHDGDKDRDFEVLIVNDHLAVDIPGQMVFELHMPDAEGKRQFRVIDSIAVTFNKDEAGEVVSMTITEPGDVSVLQRMPTLEGKTDEEAEKRAAFFELRQLGGPTQLLVKHGSFRATGKVRMPQSGVEGTIILEATYEPAAYHLKIDLGDFGTMETGSDGEQSWSFVPGQGFNEPFGPSNIELVRAHPSFLGGDWRSTFDRVELKGRRTKKGRKYEVASLSVDELQPTEVFVDLETGQVCRIESISVAGGMQRKVTVVNADFRTVHGVEMPFLVTESSAATGSTILSFDEIKVGVELAKDFHVFKGPRD